MISSSQIGSFQLSIFIQLNWVKVTRLRSCKPALCLMQIASTQISEFVLKTPFLTLSNIVRGREVGHRQFRTYTPFFCFWKLCESQRRDSRVVFGQKLWQNCVVFFFYFRVDKRTLCVMFGAWSVGRRGKKMNLFSLLMPHSTTVWSWQTLFI